MPENPANLHVVGRTADGQLWHTIRSPTGWTAFGDVLAAAGLPSLRGHVVDVACSRRVAGGSPVVEGLYVLVALDDQPPRLLLRSSNDGTWSQQPGAFFPTARKVAAGTLTTLSSPLRNEIHLAAVTDDGHLVSAVHDVSATQPVLPDDVELTAGEIGDVRAAALSTIVAIGVSGVSLLAVTADGNLLESTGRSGQWRFFAQVIAGIVGQPVPADAIDVSLARQGIVLVTGDGRVWLAIYLPNDPNNRLSSWQDLELSNVGLSDVGTFATVAAASTTQGMHVVGTTTDGHLWHQLRPSPSAVFRDVEAVGVGLDAGSFTAVDCG
jgi:hypothetical protein